MSFQAEFTSTGRLVLYDAEALIREDSDVDLLFKYSSRSGSELFAERCSVFLTDFRIVVRAQGRSTTLAHHYIASTNTEGGLFRSPKVIIHIQQRNLPQYIVSACASAGSQVPAQPSLPRNMMMKFKGGARDEFFKQLNEALTVKAWERVVTISKPKVTALGISNFHSGGIKQTMESEKKQAQETIGSAFSDMASLREKARDLTALAQQLKTYEEETKDEELREIRGVMNSLGFTTGVSEETAGRNFLQQLAREVCDFVYPHCEAAGGLISLYDVYCLYNRSRPSDMVSPTDLLNACQLMQRLSLPLSLHEFKSGIKTLQISVRSDAQIVQRVVEAVRTQGHLSVAQLSSLMNVSPIVAKQYLLIGEERCLLCRDDSIEGLHFYENRLIRP